MGIASRHTGKRLRDDYRVASVEALIDDYRIRVRWTDGLDDFFNRGMDVSVEAGLLDERADVAHVEYASGHPLRMEDLQCVRLFAGAHELDGLSGGPAHG